MCRFIDIDSRRVVGRHSGSELFTVGQKAKIGGAAQKYFIAQKCCSSAESSSTSSTNTCNDDIAGPTRTSTAEMKDKNRNKTRKSGDGVEDDDATDVVQTPRRGDVLVAGGQTHWALLSSVLETPLRDFNWVAGAAPPGLVPAGPTTKLDLTSRLIAIYPC